MGKYTYLAWLAARSVGEIYHFYAIYFKTPTANIEASDPHKIIPGYGVYAVLVNIEGVIHRGMLNIGTRPTINNNADNRSIEVHIFDFDKDIYKKQLELKFVTKIREEQKFGSIDGLRSQLQKDKLNVCMIKGQKWRCE